MSLAEFKDKFKFNENNFMHFGIERELFITKNEEFLPIAENILKEIKGLNFPSTWTYEFSACVLEQTIGPNKIEELDETIKKMFKSAKIIEDRFNIELRSYEVAPENLPDDVYPDETGRYERIKNESPKEFLDSARRTTGIHVHIGLRNHDEALFVHQTLSKETFIEYLLSIGDHSNRKRIELIKNFTEWNFDSFNSWEDFYNHLEKKNLLNDIKSYRPLIRITKHGTIEFRMFGSTDSHALIRFYTKTCYNLVRYAIQKMEKEIKKF